MGKKTGTRIEKFPIGDVSKSISSKVVPAVTAIPFSLSITVNTVLSFTPTYSCTARGATIILPTTCAMSGIWQQKTQLVCLHSRDNAESLT
jgi:hypothetical protein